MAMELKKRDRELNQWEKNGSKETLDNNTLWGNGENRDFRCGRCSFAIMLIVCIQHLANVNFLR